MRTNKEANEIPPPSDSGPIEHTAASNMGCGDCCTSECCGMTSCCHMCPCTYVWAEGLILTRDNESRNRPLVLDLGTSEVLLSTDDLDFDWSGGLRVGYDTRICGCLSAEFVYLGVFDQSASATVLGDSNLILPDEVGTDVNNFNFDNEVDVRYSSELHSFESNLVCCCSCCDCCGRSHSFEWLTGFRYIRFDEDFSITGTDPGEGTSVYKVGTENNLFGVQVGARYRACRGRWSWETTGKAGIYANEMEQSQSPIIDFLDVEKRPASQSDQTDVAFVGDLNFTAIYQLNSVWGLRAGYNLIWLDGVALAGDQLDFSIPLDSGKTLVDGGGVLLHGVNVGLEARF